MRRYYLQVASSQPKILSAAFRWWKDEASRTGRLAAAGSLIRVLWEFARDSTPSRLRQRYGDADYDWDHRVNTTSGAVGWRDRLLGVFYSAYQPTEPSLFHEMLEALRRQESFDFSDFTFIDLGSGKGRTLLMASDYPFQRIIGVELFPALNQVAQENLSKYRSESQRCFVIESTCADATTFPLPPGPLVIYLFHPFQEEGLRRFLENLQRSLEKDPRMVCILYHNPLLDKVLAETGLRKVGGTPQYSIFRS